MKKFIFKFRYYFALLLIISTISSISLLPKQSNPTNDPVMTTNGNGLIWGVETR